MKKRIFCLALALLMLVGILPVSAFAEGFTPEPPECDKGCNQTSVSAHQDQCAIKEYYRGIYRNYSAQELYNMKDILGEDAWEFILGASWSLDNAKAQELNTLIQNGGPTTPENPCKCCENCTGAEDCECVCGNCQFCEPEEPENPCKCCENCTGAEGCECVCGNCQFCKPEVPENPCKCCEDCTGAEGCECVCGNCQFCKPEVPENPCKCCENCTGAEDCECVCGNCQFCEPSETDPTDPTDPSDPTDPTNPEEPEYPTLADRETNVAVTLEILPEGVDLEVNPDADVSAQFSDFGIPAANQVFGLDITLTQGGAEYQPGGAYIKVPVDESIPVGTMIGIIHKHGNEVATFTGLTKVLSDHTVEFYTDSFSEFAGFTVDFHYEGVDYSIAGMNSIKLSELFTAMGINEDAFSATSVVFSDNTLIGVEKQDNGDWLLTSLDSFKTEETLIITFTDGHTIVIDVTDAQYPDRGKFTNHNSANDATFYHDGGSTAQGYRNFSAVSGVSSTWSVWDGGNHVIYIYLYDTAGNPVDYSYFDEHPQTGGYLGFSGNYWYEVTDYEFSVGSPGRIDADTLSMGDLGWPNIWPGPTINWVEVRMHSLNVLDNKTYAKVNQKSKFANDESGETGNRTVVVYANNVEVDRKSVLFPTFENMNASDISVSTYAGWIPRGNVSGAGATVVVADGVYKVYLVSQNTIKYDLDGGSGSFPNQTKTYGVQLNLHSGEPTKAGYTFNHWVSSYDGSTWTKGANFTPDRADTLVANYSPITYTATFNANGGSVNPTSRTFNIEGALALPTPTKAGYDFDGWKVTTASGNWSNGTTYDENTTSVAAGKYGNVTFTAQWNAISKDVVYQYDSTAPAGAVVPNKTSAAVGTEVTAATPADVTGYRFLGWTSADVTVTNGKFTMPATDVTFTGSWTLIDYTIKYELDGGTNNRLNPESYNVESEAITLANPSKTGYNFTGWTGTDLDGVTETVTIPKGSSGDRSYTANWTPKTYTITYNHNDKDTNPTTSTVSYDIEDDLTLNDAPTREGYKFSKWNLADGLTAPNGNWEAGDYNASQQIAKGMYGDIKLVAQWTDQYRYVLKFNANGGENAPATLTQEWKDENSHQFTWTTNPTREGYDFMGWATESDGEPMASKTSYTMTGKPHDTEEVTLYAVWQRQTGDLKLTFNGDQNKPAIVHVEGQDLNITLVLTKSETVIKDLPTGEYTVTAESGRATYTASVDNSNPTVVKGDTVTVGVTIRGGNSNWFTAFSRVKNQCK